MKDYNEFPEDEMEVRVEAQRKRAKEQLLHIGVPDIKAEDRIKRYDFNIDGKIITIEASDREIVWAMNEWRRQGEGPDNYEVII